MPLDQYSMKKSYNNDDSCSTKVEKLSVSVNVIERLYTVIENLNNNAIELEDRLNLLLSYGEPCDSEKNCSIEKEPSSFLEKLNVAINTLNSINFKLEFSNRHLREII